MSPECDGGSRAPGLFSSSTGRPRLQQLLVSCGRARAVPLQVLRMAGASQADQGLHSEVSGPPLGLLAEIVREIGIELGVQAGVAAHQGGLAMVLHAC